MTDAALFTHLSCTPIGLLGMQLYLALPFMELQALGNVSFVKQPAPVPTFGFFSCTANGKNVVHGNGKQTMLHVRQI